jgi:hypothetical protein
VLAWRFHDLCGDPLHFLPESISSRRFLMSVAIASLLDRISKRQSLIWQLCGELRNGALHQSQVSLVAGPRNQSNMKNPSNLNKLLGLCFW